MSTPVNHQEYFSQLRDTTWKDNLITSDGNIVPKGSWFGRACSCATRKGYSISKAQVAVMEKVKAYLGEGQEQGIVEESTKVARAFLVLTAIANLNNLVDHVLKIRPESKLEKIIITIPTTQNSVASSNEVNNGNSSSVKADTAPVGSGSTPAVPASADDVKSSSEKADDSAVEDIDSSSGEADRVPAVSAPAAEVVASADKQEPVVAKPGVKRSRDQETLDRAKEYIKMFERTFNKPKTGQ